MLRSNSGSLAIFAAMRRSFSAIRLILFSAGSGIRAFNGVAGEGRGSGDMT